MTNDLKLLINKLPLLNQLISNVHLLLQVLIKRNSKATTLLIYSIWQNVIDKYHLYYLELIVLTRCSQICIEYHVPLFLFIFNFAIEIESYKSLHSKGNICANLEHKFLHLPTFVLVEVTGNSVDVKYFSQVEQ